MLIQGCVINDFALQELLESNAIMFIKNNNNLKNIFSFMQNIFISSGFEVKYNPDMFCTGFNL